MLLPMPRKGDSKELVGRASLDALDWDLLLVLSVRRGAATDVRGAARRRVREACAKEAIVAAFMEVN